MCRRIANLVRKELLQLIRDRVTTGLILTMPVLQLALLAYVTGSGIRDLPVAVVDFDRSRASRQLIGALNNRDELAVRQLSESLADARQLLDHGEAVLLVVIPPNLGAQLTNAARTPSIQLIADGTSHVPAKSALRAGRAAAAVLAERSATGGQPAGLPIELRTSVLFNPTFNVRFFAVPAQVGFIVYQVTLTVAAISLARERELGTLEQLLVMPLRRTELLIGKALPASIIGMINFVLMLAIAVLGFQIPMVGSLPLLLGLTLLFIVVEISYGMLISSTARTQQQALLMVFVMAMFDMTFSGYMVRVKNLPAALRAVAQVVPFSHYLTVIRAIMLKGVGLDDLWPHVMAMVLTGGAVILIALRNLRRNLD